MKNKRNIAVILGDWRLPDPAKPGGKFDEDDFDTVKRLEKALKKLVDYRFSYFDNHKTLAEDLLLQASDIDLALNLCDEGFMNDPAKEAHIPVLLETLNIPYTGAGLQCMEKCYNKRITRNIAQSLGISVPQGFVINRNSGIAFPDNFPVIVKPAFGDGSFGINQKSVSYNKEEFTSSISELRKIYEKDILVEEFLQGDDLTLGIIGNPQDYSFVGITKEDFSCLDSHQHLPKIAGREAKWHPESPYWKISPVTADLEKKTRKKIISGSQLLFQELECRDYARFDWRLNSEGIPKLLEANPNPGWCYDGHLARAAGLKKINYSNMLDLILKAAEKRLGLNKYH